MTMQQLYPGFLSILIGRKQGKRISLIEIWQPG